MRHKLRMAVIDLLSLSLIADLGYRLGFGDVQTYGSLLVNGRLSLRLSGD
jgi:hypothetical protein